MATSTAAALNLGTCWGTPMGQDLSSPSYMATGNVCVGEAIARRWSTTPGKLIDDPTYGYNLTDLIGSDLTPTQIAYAAQQLASEAQKDERVQSAVVFLTSNAAGTLTATATIVTGAGPFKLVLSVSDVSPATMQVSP
jgi:hypothetical protein